MAFDIGQKLSAHLPTCVVRPGGSIVETNDAFKALQSVANANADLNSIWSYSSQSDNKLQLYFEDRVHAGDSFEFEMRAGSITEGKWYRVQVFPFRENHEALAMVIWSLRSEKIRLSEEANDVLHSINESLQEGFYRSTADGNIRYVNQAFADMFGFTAPEEMKDIHASVMYVDPAARQELVLELTEAGRITNREVLFKKKDGSIFWGLLSVSQNEDENGEIHLDGALRDITKIKEIERQLKIEMQNAEAATLAKQQFLSTISHELRTPLNAVIGLTHLLIDENPREDQLESMKALLYSANSLLGLINDVLDFSKIEAGHVQLTKEKLVLASEAERIIESFRPQAEQKGIDLKVELDERIPQKLFSDKLRLQQVLNNLISNALKFTFHGEVKLSFGLVENNRDDVRVRISVEDTGIGIPQNKIDSVFEVFTQASSSTTRKFGGTGLGLAITRNLVELFGGELKVESEAGKGSKFYFDANFGRSIQREPLVDVKMPEKKISSVSFDGKRILAVEDNEVNQLLLKRFIGEWGADVELASNGIEALMIAQENEFDIVLMDIQMPGMDGYVATRNIRQLGGSYSNVPILAVTASMRSEVQDRSQQAGMTDILLKPYSPEELAAKLQEYL
ncbi:PAS domain-containing hybrid sensor histidine kinase/response regulator [Sanyastnella coralliicola]|uniref:PAS domain-containing hybrid sensor histidine kinase/response regulator n=1 Tax=Sanyastnella coralliicola TaxID=3069118 RepID=UPI0027BA5472|nr:PAS domain-containing hybrid sensor histidine kinase/response regulator [Longitalea sp. SCSIO 12813]